MVHTYNYVFTEHFNIHNSCMCIARYGYSDLTGFLVLANFLEGYNECWCFPLLVDNP